MKWLQFSTRMLLAVMLACAYGFWRYGAHYREEQERDRMYRSRIVSTYWDARTGENIQWAVPLGSQTLATPVVAGGKVFIGSNNGHGYLARYPSSVDLGVLLCFDLHGKFLWQHSNHKLKTGRANDWPLVRGDRLWYVTNRCEVVCLDTEGFYDNENDGAFRQEVPGSTEADVVWKFDMIARLGVYPHNMSYCNVVTDGARLFVGTSNGVDVGHVKIPAPHAPSFIALDLATGKLLWQDNSPGDNLVHGQWGSPAFGVLGGVPQVLFPGGDGWLYSFAPAGNGRGGSKLLWKFDCNPKDVLWGNGGTGTRNNLITAPVIHDGLVYQTTGQDPEHGEGPGRIWCIDPTRRGDVSPDLLFNKNDPRHPIRNRRWQACDPAQGDYTTINPNSAAVWCYIGTDLNGDGRLAFDEEMHRSLGRVAIRDDLLFATDIGGLVHCLDRRTGVAHWTYDQMSTCWNSPVIAGDYLYVGDEDGDVSVFALSADPLVAVPGGVPVFETQMRNSVYGTPVAADNVLYLVSRTHLWAIKDGGKFVLP